MRIEDFTESQRRAFDAIIAWSKDKDSRHFALSGPAGTGKTTLLAQLIPALQRETGTVAVTAMTGKAALRVRQATGYDATTLHSALYKPPDEGREGLSFTEVREPEMVKGVLVIDEASMVTPQVFEDLRIWTNGMGRDIKVLFVGDDFQLPPVIDKDEATRWGEDFTIFGEVAGARLSEVMRASGGIVRSATHLRETGELRDDENFELVSSPVPDNLAIGRYVEDPGDHLLVTWRNVPRMAANKQIRKKLKVAEDVRPQPGEPIVAKRNGYGLRNGDRKLLVGIRPNRRLAGVVETQWMDYAKDDAAQTLDDVGGPEDVSAALINMEGNKEPLDGGFPYLKDKDDFRRYMRLLRDQQIKAPIPITYGYCLTAHAAQGSEFRRVSVFLTNKDLENPYFKKMTELPSGSKAPFGVRWLYTAITRGRECVQLLLQPQ